MEGSGFHVGPCLAAVTLTLIVACDRDTPPKPVEREARRTQEKEPGLEQPAAKPTEIVPVTPTSREGYDADPGPPLVDKPDTLKRLHPTARIWLDVPQRQVVLQGVVCQRAGPLELFACLADTKEYESVVATAVPAHVVQAGLIALGLEPGHPVQFQPSYVPPTGPKIQVIVRWKDTEGRIQTVPAQHWIRRMRTAEAMDLPWVFAGSRFITTEENGKPIFAADATGDLICVSNFTTSLLDVPVPSTTSDDDLLYEAFTEHIPERGTPVTVLLRPAEPSAEPAKQ